MNIAISRLARYAAVTCTLVFCAAAIKGGTAGGIATATVIALLIPCLYLAFTRPLVLPYALYVLLIPFDNLVTAGHELTVTRLLGAACGVAIFMWCIRKNRIVQPSWALAFLFAFVFWCATSVSWALDQNDAVAALPTYASLAMLYVAIAVMPLNERQFKFLLGTAILGGVASALYGIYVFYHDPFEMAMRDPQLQRVFVDAQGNAQVDPNQFANALLLPAAALIMFALRTPRISAKIAYVSCLAVVTVALMLSASREAALGLVVILGYYLIRSRYRIALSFVVGALVFVAGNVQSALWIRFGTDSQRSSIWMVGFEAFKHNWLTGYGVGNFLQAYDAYYIRVPQSYSNGWVTASHNLLVHYAVELGIVGVVLIGAFFVAHFYDLRMIRPESDLYDMRLVMEASLIALLFVAMFIDLFTYKYAWLVLALAAQLRSVAILESPYALRQAGHDLFSEARFEHKGLPSFTETAEHLRV